VFGVQGGMYMGHPAMVAQPAMMPPNNAMLPNAAPMVSSQPWNSFCLFVCFYSDRQHLSYDVCLEVRREIIRTVPCCIVY